ncbi:hypothetical protein [Rhizobium sp. 12,4]|uniref:hypothetical protein n=1 Tax=Rhizobium sp. 12,4 TaxID=3405135 RepID=UPI003D34911B
MKPKRKVITNLKISEISAVDTPAVAGAIVRVMKSADGDRDSKPAVASPAIYSPTREGEVVLAKMLAAIRGEPITKFRNEESRTMSNETHYERLTKSYSQREGVSIQKAAERLMQDDPQAVAEAYDKDEAAEVARRFGETTRD